MSTTPTGTTSTGRASVGAATPSRGGGGRGPTGRRRSGGAPRRGAKPRWGRIALVAIVALALLAGLGAGGVYLYLKHFDSKVSRIDAFSKITGDRPPRLVAGAQNILLLGSDSRDPSRAANEGGWRTDTLILMHITASHDKAYLISIPRDTWVFIPRSASQPSLGNTKAKINASFSWGGVPLTVQTVEGFTGVHIDHVMLINFGGFQQVTDALGGVDMRVDQTITSIHPPYRVFQKGDRHFTGAEALDYIRQRKQFAGGDFTRVQHQQLFLKAVMDKAASTGTLTNPAKLNSFLDALTKAVVVDQDMSLLDMSVQFRGLRSSDMTFLTSPSAGSAMEEGQSVVEPDRAKALSLYDAVGKDTIARWLAAHPS